MGVKVLDIRHSKNTVDNAEPNTSLVFLQNVVTSSSFFRPIGRRTSVNFTTVHCSDTKGYDVKNDVFSKA